MGEIECETASQAPQPIRILAKFIPRNVEAIRDFGHVAKEEGAASMKHSMRLGKEKQTIAALYNAPKYAQADHDRGQRVARIRTRHLAPTERKNRPWKAPTGSVTLPDPGASRTAVWSWEKQGDRDYNPLEGNAVTQLGL